MTVAAALLLPLGLPHAVQRNGTRGNPTSMPSSQALQQATRVPRAWPCSGNEVQPILSSQPRDTGSPPPRGRILKKIMADNLRCP
eukprot:CAMPEP_0174304836 /NCGR_PEP_ID=MMETSP0809-20121228/61032_1 /TAXON_ID=73025 ORGANISM="Eutreptiella gymnastica-like, Strain CCMP1594" /NCGR_SAMPLE_ID=MMETSP0809 /ASSEMBLY_ACC=CAM_ASM_000658 /LENGTH=84 /DNA_ID=CAMNT_0015411153 /DNA_START=626 /DNA_END=880 /DNA_ORIENTATION=+